MKTDKKRMPEAEMGAPVIKNRTSDAEMGAPEIKKRMPEAKEGAPEIKNRMPELTRAEFEIMRILWDKEKALVHGVLEEMPEPKPAYNTVSTIVRILEKKGFVGHTAYGKTHEYYPLVGRGEYTERYMDSVLGNFFDGSLVQMVSFFTQRENVSTEDFDRMIDILEQLKNQPR